MLHKQSHPARSRDQCTTPILHCRRAHWLHFAHDRAVMCVLFSKTAIGVVNSIIAKQLITRANSAHTAIKSEFYTRALLAFLFGSKNGKPKTATTQTTTTKANRPDRARNTN